MYRHTHINKFTSHLKLRIINELIGNYVSTTDKIYSAHYKLISTHFKCTCVCVDIKNINNVCFLKKERKKKELNKF